MDFRPEYAQLWEAVTAYDVYGQSLQGEGASRKALTRLDNIYRSVSGIAATVGTSFVPAVSPGFNDRDGHAGRPRYFTDEPDSREGDLFRRMIREVARPNLDARTGNMLMVTSFNEWYEDTQVEATAGTAEATRKDDSTSETHYTQGDLYPDYGSLYLDILREETGQGTPK